MQKSYKKRFVWTRVHEIMLLDLWQTKMCERHDTRKKSQIFREMSNELSEEHGLSVTPMEIKMKINNLTTKYKKEKAAMWASGGTPSKWPLFPRIHHILKETEFIKQEADPLHQEDDKFFCEPPLKYKDYLQERTLSASPPPSSPSRLSLTSSPSFRRNTATKNKDFQKYLFLKFNKSLKIMEQHMAAMQEADEQIIALEREKVQLLRQQVQDGAELKEVILKILSEVEIATSVT